MLKCFKWPTKTLHCNVVAQRNEMLENQCCIICSGKRINLDSFPVTYTSCPLFVPIWKKRGNYFVYAIASVVESA